MVQNRHPFRTAGSGVNATTWILRSRSASLRLPVDDEGAGRAP